mgnify:FL=1
MKRFSIFFAALFAAVTSFAAVTYELNGGVQSEWESPQAMYDALNGIWNTFSGTEKAWGNLEELKANVAQGIPTQAGTMDLTFIADSTFKAKFEWLVTYMDAKCTEQGQTLPSTNASFLRYNLQAFFIDGVRASWPASANYTTCGVSTLDAYQPYWKSSFVNPTEPTTEVTLYAPYKEGATFDGWYAAADFSGEKVTKIDATTTGTLYAKWVEYIPTIAEVRALADDAETKVAGVVNHVDGKNIYIQDATGGILVYTKENATCKVGEKILAKGVKVMYAGAPEVKNAVVESAEAGELATPLAFENLAALVSDSILLKNFAMRVTVPGLKIVSYDDKNYPTVADALGNEAKCYKMVLNPAENPIGSKVTVTAVAGWFYGFQFVGDVAGLKVVPGPKKDAFEYPARHDGRYTLTNNWVVSIMEENFIGNQPGGAQYVRGMAAKDGIMYFINRELGAIVPVKGENGEMLDPIKITGEHVFQKVTGTDSVSGEQTWGDAATLPFNDIKFDQAGNCLIGACVSASSGCQPFQIYMVDLATGAATEIVNDVLWDNPGLDSTAFRFDAFGVAGDVTKNGVIMAADAIQGNWKAYRWLIKDGVVGEGELINIMVDPATTESLFANAAGLYTAPQIFPQDEEGAVFYVDGFNTMPMLCYGDAENGASVIDDFIHVPTGVKVWNNAGDTLSMNPYFNGLVEFQVGEEYFLLMVATNNEHAVAKSAYALFKFADADRAYEGMEPLWYFPAKGLGNATNGCRTAVPSVEVQGNTAVLYLYATDNGYATYTLTINTAAAVENVEAVKVEAKKVVENGQVYILKNGVKYNVLGAEVK